MRVIMTGRLWMTLLVAVVYLCMTAAAATFPRTHHLRYRRMGTVADTAAVDFIDSCTASLLSDDAVSDNLISQDEFTQFLSDYCTELQVCAPGSTLDFQNLSVELQLAFVLFICNEPAELDREACLVELNSMGQPFGYDLLVEEREVLDTELQELCSLAFFQSSRSGLLPPTLGTYEKFDAIKQCVDKMQRFSSLLCTSYDFSSIPNATDKYAD